MAFRIVADVGGREVSWSYDNGSAEAQKAREFWHKMKVTRRTPDTDSPVFSATLYRNGKVMAQIEDAA